MDFLVGGIAASCACVFTHPMDVLKTRFQFQGELKARGQHVVHYRNILHAGFQIWKHEGIASLQKGLVSGIWVQLIMNSCRLGGFQYLTEKGWITDENGQTVFYKSFLGTGALGMLGHFLSNPVYILKTQKMAMSAKAISVGYQHENLRIIPALIKIIKSDGIAGLYRGTGAAMPRAFACTFSQLMGFAYGKDLSMKYDYVKNKPFLATFLGAMLGGVAITAFTTPFDLIMVRLYNQERGPDGKGIYYKGYFDCAYKILQSEGPSAFYKGFGPMYMRLGPHTILTFIFWDILKDVKSKITNKEKNNK